MDRSAWLYYTGYEEENSSCTVHWANPPLLLARILFHSLSVLPHQHRVTLTVVVPTQTEQAKTEPQRYSQNRRSGWLQLINLKITVHDVKTLWFTGTQITSSQLSCLCMKQRDRLNPAYLTLIPDAACLITRKVVVIYGARRGN